MYTYKGNEDNDNANRQKIKLWRKRTCCELGQEITEQLC